MTRGEEGALAQLPSPSHDAAEEGRCAAAMKDELPASSTLADRCRLHATTFVLRLLPGPSSLHPLPPSLSLSFCAL